MLQLIYDQERDCVIGFVQSKGLSAGEDDWKNEKGMDPRSIRRRFLQDIFKVPCSRLEFQEFDKHLNAEIQNAPGWRRNICSS